MNQKPGIAFFKQSISVLLIIVSLSMISFNASYTPITQDDTSIESTQAGEANQDAESVLKIYDAIQTHFQVNLSFQSILMDVVAVSVEKKTTPIATNQFVLSQSKGFKILLQRIISTNAP